MNAHQRWQNGADPSEHSYGSVCCSCDFSRFWGALFLLIGILLLLSNFGILPILGQVFWPLLLIGLGIANLVRIWRRRE